MLDSIWSLTEDVLGLGKDNLNAGEMAARAVITFIITVAIVRVGDKRMLGKGTAFDVVVAIMIGSIMSRAITASSPLFATWLAGLILVLAHWLLAFLAYRFDWLGPLIKGVPKTLIKDGVVQREAVRKGAVTKLDLQQALRMEGHDPDPSGVDMAVLERDGSISVLPRSKGPRVLDVTVEDGIQTVRIALE